MKSRETLLKEELGEENYQMIQQIKKLNSKRGVQASLPFELEIK